MGTRVLSSAELSRLWQKHAAALLLIARGHCGTVAGGVAEDCVQEAFIRLARQEHQPDVPEAWLMTAVRNAAIDGVRAQQRRTNREQAVARERSRWLTPVNSTAAADVSAEEVQQALQKLDDVTRDVVVAHLWNNMTFRQIASVFDLSRATAHRRYEVGIEQLRAMMTEAERPASRHALPLGSAPDDRCSDAGNN